MFVIVGRGRNPKTIKVYHIIIDKTNTLSIEQSPQDTHETQLTSTIIPTDVIIHDKVCQFINYLICIITF